MLEDHWFCFCLFKVLWLEYLGPTLLLEGFFCPNLHLVMWVKDSFFLQYSS